MTAVSTYPVTAATGLAETALPESLLARLPATAPPAPWNVRCLTVTWLHPADDGGTVAWALVRYEDTPVGPYSELAATRLPDDPEGYGTIPFIVVDSLPSIVGGRVNWLLPKALANFTWSPATHSVTASAVEPAIPAWSATITIQPSGDSSQLAVPNRLEQVTGDGTARRFTGKLTGSFRPARVTVDAQADGPLAGLLHSGSYDGGLMTDCRFAVGPLE